MSELKYIPTSEQTEDQQLDDPIAIEEKIQELKDLRFPLAQESSRLWLEIKAIDHEIDRWERKKEINKQRYFKNRIM